MTEDIKVTHEEIISERRDFQFPTQTFKALTLNGVTTVACSQQGNVLYIDIYRIFMYFLLLLPKTFTKSDKSHYILGKFFRIYVFLKI